MQHYNEVKSQPIVCGPKGQKAWHRLRPANQYVGLQKRPAASKIVALRRLKKTLMYFLAALANETKPKNWGLWFRGVKWEN